jgi:WD40 repeat protein
MQVVWDLSDGKALCGAPVSAAAVSFFNLDNRLITCGHDNSLFVWQLDKAARKLARLAVQLGHNRCNFTALAISADDSQIFLGCTSGDVAEVDSFSRHHPTMPSETIKNGNLHGRASAEHLAEHQHVLLRVTPTCSGEHADPAAF